MGSLFRSLMRFSNRFANLSLSLSPRDFLYFDDLSPSQFPILTSLCLRDANLHEGIYGHLEDGPSEISFTSLLQRMPVLRKLQVKEFAFRSSFSRTLGVESLTSLDFTANAMGSFGVTVDVVQGLNLLSQMPRLRFLKAAIQLGVNADGENTPLPTIHLKHLEEMHMAFVRRSRPLLTGRMAAFFNHLKCPSLKTLGISWHGLLLSEVPFRGLPLHELETLALNVTMRWDTLLECLSLVPNLKSLQLRATEGRLENNPGHNLVHCALRDSHLSGLTFSAQNPLPLCPQLQKFQYLDKVLTSTDIVSTRVLTDFIESRQDTLKCCEMFFPVKPLFTEEELDRLKIVKQGGLELHLHSAKPFRTKRLDEPTVGLVSWLVHETPIQKVYEIVDMEGPYGTDVII
ncbi:hypothetical protein GYMLUDRAFT_47958 [Collybiopsis luxurians FD-317 M1]|uniref:Uncharacterized protein n=1 Tax=Collybiopsis luxurians FD-317 M1 TaxID=944289 RepID=A0A0D0CAY5_9AGAR|nr:hypothetical protein GYMLUDRAFT_47958 [Collybiopsis luxurians FD-317 M1]